MQENHQLHRDLTTLEKAITERLGYLQRFKVTCTHTRVHTLYVQYLPSVPWYVNIMQSVGVSHGSAGMSLDSCCQDLHEHRRLCVPPPPRTPVSRVTSFHFPPLPGSIHIQALKPPEPAAQRSPPVHSGAHQQAAW